MENYNILKEFKAGLFTGLVETWVDIKDYEGIYQVSSLGNVKSLPRFRYGKRGELITVQGKLLKQKTTESGYKTVHLRDADRELHPSVHRMVATSFIRNTLDKPTVNHIDGNKANNSVSNLEWSTQSEQMLHAVKNNLLEVRGTAKYTKEFKTLVYNFYIENKISIKKLAEHFSISERTAGRIAQGVEPRKTTRVKKDGTVIVDNIITKEQVLEIKALRESGWTFAKLSERFNRGMSQIHRIVNDKSRVSEIE
jgi:transposase-like protein